VHLPGPIDRPSEKNVAIAAHRDYPTLKKRDDFLFWFSIIWLFAWCAAMVWVLFHA
jgi:hypothetical protein